MNQKEEKYEEALIELLYKIADDLLIIGHRNSEWTGLGPILEEDISFSSMAQDKIGQSMSVFNILHSLGEPEPDTNAFNRSAKFHNSQLVELPNGEYDFSLIRHLLYDHADQLRFEMLANSSFEPLAKLARKIKGELKYHVYHADTLVTKLGNAKHESHDRMQKALNEAWNYALGIFEESEFEKTLIQENIFAGEKKLKEKWLNSIQSILEKAQLKIPGEGSWKPAFGGREGHHTQHLKPLVEEMSEVFRVDPKAEW
ncbi:MAG: 1,2-phenylacetyl-CoA epoxidase subunit PaaC [Bacteroidia bacterium]